MFKGSRTRRAERQVVGQYSTRGRCCSGIFFFFNDTATTEIYTLSLHDALPISSPGRPRAAAEPCGRRCGSTRVQSPAVRSEEHTSELQSQSNLVCRLLLEKKKKKYSPIFSTTSLTLCLRLRHRCE